MVLDPLTLSLIGTGVGAGGGILSSLIGGGEDNPLRGLDDLIRDPAFPPAIKKLLFETVIPRFDVLQDEIFGLAGRQPLTPEEQFVQGQLGQELGFPQQQFGQPQTQQQPFRPEITNLLRQQREEPGRQPIDIETVPTLDKRAVEERLGFIANLSPTEKSAVLQQFQQAQGIPIGAGQGAFGLEDISEAERKNVLERVQFADPLSTFQKRLLTQEFATQQGVEFGGGGQPAQQAAAREVLSQPGSHTPLHIEQKAAATQVLAQPATTFASGIPGVGQPIPTAQPPAGIAAQPPQIFGPTPGAIAGALEPVLGGGTQQPITQPNITPPRPGTVTPPQPQRPSTLGAIRESALGRLQAPTVGPTAQLPQLPDFGAVLQQRIGDVQKAIEERGVSRGLDPSGGILQQLQAQGAERIGTNLIPQEAQFGLQRAALGQQLGQFPQQLAEQQRQSAIRNLFGTLGQERGLRQEFTGLAATGRQREREDVERALQSLLGGTQDFGKIFQQFTVNPSGGFQSQVNPLGEAIGDVSGKLLGRGLEGLFPGQQQEDPFARFLRQLQQQQNQPGRIVSEVTGGF